MKGGEGKVSPWDYAGRENKTKVVVGVVSCSAPFVCI